MCIAILNTAGLIPEEYLFNSYSNNPDGNGIIWAENNTLYTFKNFNYNEFLDKYYKVREIVKTPIAIHFRIATSGKIDLKNCHPFSVNSKLAFIHNGVIPKLGNNTLSDTFIYNETVLKQLQNNFLKSRLIKEKISKEIGYSKLVFLDNTARYTIINEHYGHWNNNNWYSNDSYKYSYSYVEPSQNYYQFDDDFDDYAEYYRNTWGIDTPDYYDQLTDDEKSYLFDLIDLGYDTPPDLDSFLFDYQIYTATLKENEQQLELF